jgi:hypothetical protein
MNLDQLAPSACLGSKILKSDHQLISPNTNGLGVIETFLKK